MRILFVTPSFPWPPRSGHSLIACAQMQLLAKRHMVDLVSFADTQSPDAGELSNCCAHIQSVVFQRWMALLNKGWGLFKDRPLQVSYFHSVRMMQAVESRLRGGSYEAVIFYTTAMAQYLPNWYQGVAIWHMIDPLVLNNERFWDRCSWRERVVARNRIARLQRYEERYAKRFSRVLLLNEADVRDYQPRLQGARLDWVPHGVDTDAFRPPTGGVREPGMIVITGNMNHHPNVDAVNVFCRDVFPAVCRRVPSANLWLVGSNPSAVIRWTKNQKIKATGFVPDIRPYLSRAMVSVCAVRLDVGTQTKVLEAMASGTPVVTTSAGNHGVGAVSGRHLYVTDDGEEFAERIVALLNGESWATLSTNGRAFVVENFAWQRSSTKLEGILEQVVQAHGESDL